MGTNEAKYTLGPWEFKVINRAFEVHSRFGLIAEPCGRSVSETKANARLIAAAPELLEALKAAKAFHTHQGIDVFPVSDVIDRAIAKATGAA